MIFYFQKTLLLLILIFVLFYLFIFKIVPKTSCVLWFLGSNLTYLEN